MSFYCLLLPLLTDATFCTSIFKQKSRAKIFANFEKANCIKIIENTVGRGMIIRDFS